MSDTVYGVKVSSHGVYGPVKCFRRSNGGWAGDFRRGKRRWTISLYKKNFSLDNLQKSVKWGVVMMGFMDKKSAEGFVAGAKAARTVMLDACAPVG